MLREFDPKHFLSPHEPVQARRCIKGDAPPLAADDAKVLDSKQAAMTERLLHSNSNSSTSTSSRPHT